MLKLQINIIRNYLFISVLQGRMQENHILSWKVELRKYFGEFLLTLIVDLVFYDILVSCTTGLTGYKSAPVLLLLLI